MNTKNPLQNAQSCSKPQGWDYAVFVAERQIEEAEEKIKRLRLSIKTFEEMRAKGEPFPVDVKDQSEAESNVAQK